ncbi:paired amphipathic helix protein Sin3b [Lates japonicus]|uniref:Paired amphipathic helix protein Sin3b n=1 Tax=Lates japonicus TaxID=270547 RepID=A0AAD3MAE5_LATJO|nr:paired amphipathic helix protein Sin3b [Lates japonicus]
MVFVANSEDYIYRRGALVKAGSAERWLMGEEEEDMIPCKTTCLSTAVKGQTVNRYQVHYGGSKAPASP